MDNSFELSVRSILEKVRLLLRGIDDTCWKEEDTALAIFSAVVASTRSAAFACVILLLLLMIPTLLLLLMLPIECMDDKMDWSYCCKQ